MIDAVCPDGSEEMKAHLLKSPKSEAWMDGAEGPKISVLLNTIADAYRTAETWQQRLQILSLVSNAFPLSLLQQFIPGLSSYMFTQARLYGATTGAGIHTEAAPRAAQQFDRKRLWTALDFIASDMVSIPAPFGSMTMKLSSGEKREIDLYIRQQSNENIYKWYNNYMEQTGQQADLLSRSVFLMILKKCPAKTRHSIHGLDSYTYAGLEAIESLIHKIEGWNKGGLADKAWADDQKGALQDIKMYLRGDYKAHISQSS